MRLSILLAIAMLAILLAHNLWASLEFTPRGVAPPRASVEARNLDVSAKSQQARRTFALVASGLMGLAAVYVIFNYGDYDRKWAYAVIGAIFGFWLRPGR
jgi:hypothetical protein